MQPQPSSHTLGGLTTNMHLWRQVVLHMHTRHSQHGKETHLRSHTSPGQSPTRQPLWSIILPYRPSHHHSPQALTPLHTHTHSHVMHNITQTTPLMVLTFFMFHAILYNEQTPHTQRLKKASLYYTFQKSTVLAPCNLVPLTPLLHGQMEPY